MNLWPFESTTGDFVKEELQELASQSLSQSWKFAQNATTSFLCNLVLLFGAFYGWQLLSSTL